MKILQKSALGLFCIILILLAIKFTSPLLRIDGYTGLLWSYNSPSGENTRYAKGYSHSRFLQIKRGMTEMEVKSILGEPLSKWELDKNKTYSWPFNFLNNDFALIYSDSPTSQDYRIRSIYFKNAKVNWIRGDYYVD